MCGRIFYTEQAFGGESKTTGEADRDLTIKYTVGLGEDMLRQMWAHAIGSPDSLARIGVQVFPGQVCLDIEGVNPKPRLMSFLLCLGEARFWSYAFKQWSLPEGFACFLVSPEVTDPGNSASSDQIKEAHQFWQDFFEAAWNVEAEADSDP